MNLCTVQSDIKKAMAAGGHRFFHQQFPFSGGKNSLVGKQSFSKKLQGSSSWGPVHSFSGRQNFAEGILTCTSRIILTTLNNPRETTSFRFAISVSPSQNRAETRSGRFSGSDSEQQQLQDGLMTRVFRMMGSTTSTSATGRFIEGQRGWPQAPSP